MGNHFIYVTTVEKDVLLLNWQGDLIYLLNKYQNLK